MYAYYGRTEAMLANILRDAETMPVVRDTMSGFDAYMDAARETLLRGRGVRGAVRRRVAGALGHALSFTTWRSLVREQGLSDAQAVALMCDLISAAQAATAPR